MSTNVRSSIYLIQYNCPVFRGFALSWIGFAKDSNTDRTSVEMVKKKAVSSLVNAFEAFGMLYTLQNRDG